MVEKQTDKENMFLTIHLKHVVKLNMRAEKRKKKTWKKDTQNWQYKYLYVL